MLRLDNETASGIIRDRIDLLREQEATEIDPELLASVRAEILRWQTVLGEGETESFFRSLLAETERQIASMQWTQEGLALLLDTQRRCKDALEIAQ